MEAITVDKSKLAEKLNRNKEKHRDLFVEAHEAYQEKIIEAFTQRLEKARNGEKVSLSIHAYEPEDHTKDYERAIQMLEWEQSDDVVLSETDFRRLVQDDWGWKDQFAATYTSNTGKSL